MKTQSPLTVSLFNTRWLALAAGLLVGGSCAFAQVCPPNTNWFPHSQTPAPDPNIFPGNPAATDCDFYQWAWQEFLYVTQNYQGQPRFLSYPTDTDLFPSDPTQKPLKSAALKARNTRPPLKLKVRNVKARLGGTVEDASSIFQATGGILVDENGNPLFYSVHFSTEFYDFIESNNYYDYSTYTNTNPEVTFPPGATEFKASWMIITNGAKFAGFTTQAQVPTLSTVDVTNIVAGPPLRNVTVGLVGLHVVGVVANHPEFIWATFEQVHNAPDLPSNVSPTSSSPVSSSNYTFYAANTPANQCNIQASSFTLNTAAQTLSPITQVFRQDRDGGGIPDNILAIDTLNTSVRALLATAGDVWSNYRAIGGVWLLPGALVVNMAPSGTQLHGSTNVANSTMETFIQGPVPGNSCFLCHTTTSSTTSGGLFIPPMNMNLSHTFTDGLVTQESARRKLKAKK